MTFGLDREIDIPIRPLVVSGNPPPLTSAHVAPPSVVFHSPEPLPPDVRKYAPRTRWYAEANSTFGFDGSIATSTNPVESSMNLISFHVTPPSSVLYSPRSGFAFHAAPSAAT